MYTDGKEPMRAICDNFDTVTVVVVAVVVGILYYRRDR